MSIHTYPILDRWPQLLDLAIANVGQPANAAVTDTQIVFTYTPDLTAALATTLDRLAIYCRLDVNLTPAEWLALTPKLAEIRTFRARSLATWNALAATAREADEIAYLNDLTDVLRALLRD